VKIDRIQIRQGIKIVIAMEPLRRAMVCGSSNKAKKIVNTYKTINNITPVKASIFLSFFILVLS
jgi:hypothetical protein